MKILFQTFSFWRKGALTFLLGPAALLILCSSFPSSKFRASIPQFSVARGRSGCECKCIRKKRFCDSSCKLTMASFSFCQMASKFLWINLLFWGWGRWRMTELPPRVKWGKGMGWEARESLICLQDNWLLQMCWTRLGMSLQTRNFLSPHAELRSWVPHRDFPLWTISLDKINKISLQYVYLFIGTPW